MSENHPSLENVTSPAAEPALPVPAPVTPTPPIPPAPTASAVPRKRPTGITIIALLALISGFLGLCCGSPLILLGGIGMIIPTGVTQVLGILGILLGVLLAFGPFLQVIFAYGAWNLRSWAWWLGIVATGISVAGVIISILGSDGATLWTAVTNALLPIIIFVYLLFPDVRQAFRV
jgi:hypothetical protein